MKAFFTRSLPAILFFFTSVSFAQLSDPIPQTIEFGDLNMVLKEWVSVPATSSSMPLARINMMREVPRSGGVMAINDLNGPMYLVEESGDLSEFIDLSEEFPDFIPSPGKGTGFGAFTFHPNYRENGIFFTSHAESAGSGTADFVPIEHNGIALQWVVTKWVDSNPIDSEFSGSHSEMMRLEFPSHIHGLQDMAFNWLLTDEEADDFGNLYICVGEGGSGLDRLHANMQTTESHLGTIFRIDPLGTNSENGNYGIPSDNPFVSDANAIGEIWAYGFRNPHRLHFEERSGEIQLFSGDIGEKTIEEVNLVQRGKNYGWDKREGTFLFDIDLTRNGVYELPDDDDTFDYTYPVAQYDHDEGLAIVSGHVWNNDRVQAFNGQFFMGDIPSGRVFNIPVESLPQGSQVDFSEVRLFNEDLEETNLKNLVGSDRVDLRFGFNSENEVFILSKANGTVYKLSSLEQEIEANLVAFPGAEGFGRNATGGRGGQVYTVTNLNNSGPGSLREAVEQSGTRTIVFAVSGVINLESPLRIEIGNLTIAGQTSPNGITLAGYSTIVGSEGTANDNNIIIRFLRFRMGDQNQYQGDALECRFASNVIIDHCSFSWSIDETMSMYRNRNTTFQWNIVSESLDDSFHEKGAHGYGGIWGGSYSSFHHNLIAHHTNRNPRLNGARFDGDWDEHMDFRNNVIYNWGGNSIYGGEPSEIDGNKAKINMVNNYYKAGPASDVPFRIVKPDDMIVDNGPDYGYSNFYIDGNKVFGYDDVSADNWTSGVQGVTEEEKAEIRVDVPYDFHMNSNHSADEAFEMVLRNAGCVMPSRDDIDTRITLEAAMGTFTHGNKGIIDSQGDTEGYPTVDNPTPPTDTDGDGMPDDWETANGLDPDDETDGSEDANGDGYTNLEEYLNELVEFTLSDQIEYIPQVSDLEAVVDAVVSNRVTLTWGDYPVSGAELILERSIEENTGYEEIATLGTEEEYVDNVSTEQDRYVYYRMKAESGSNESVYSQVAEAYIREYVTSIEERDLGLNIYPNPAGDYFRIIASTSEIQVVSVGNLLGQEIPFKIEWINGDLKIDSRSWEKGMYFVTLKLNGESQTLKVIKD